MARVFLYSGSALTSIGVGLLSRMSPSFGGATLQVLLGSGPRVARTPTVATVTATHKTLPIEVSVRTLWGAVKVPLMTFAVMSGSDYVVLFGVATMKALGLDLYPWSQEKLRPSAVPVQTGVTSPSFLAARRVTLPVESFQNEVADDAPADVAVERLVEKEPDMFPMDERGARDRGLEDSVPQAERGALSADGACRLRDILSRRVDIFRRPLRGDPLPHVEPMRVDLKPQVQAVKARPRWYDPVKTGWLAGASRIWGRLVCSCGTSRPYGPVQPWRCQKGTLSVWSAITRQ